MAVNLSGSNPFRARLGSTARILSPFHSSAKPGTSLDSFSGRAFRTSTMTSGYLLAFGSGLGIASLFKPGLFPSVQRVSDALSIGRMIFDGSLEVGSFMNYLMNDNWTALGTGAIAIPLVATAIVSGAFLAAKKIQEMRKHSAAEVEVAPLAADATPPEPKVAAPAEPLPPEAPALAPVVEAEAEHLPEAVVKEVVAGATGLPPPLPETVSVEPPTLHQLMSRTDTIASPQDRYDFVEEFINLPENSDWDSQIIYSASMANRYILGAYQARPKLAEAIEERDQLLAALENKRERVRQITGPTRIFHEIASIRDQWSIRKIQKLEETIETLEGLTQSGVWASQNLVRLLQERNPDFAELLDRLTVAEPLADGDIIAEPTAPAAKPVALEAPAPTEPAPVEAEPLAPVTPEAPAPIAPAAVEPPPPAAKPVAPTPESPPVAERTAKPAPAPHETQAQLHTRVSEHIASLGSEWSDELKTQFRAANDAAFAGAEAYGALVDLIIRENLIENEIPARLQPEVERLGGMIRLGQQQRLSLTSNAAFSGFVWPDDLTAEKEDLLQTLMDESKPSDAKPEVAAEKDAEAQPVVAAVSSPAVIAEPAAPVVEVAAVSLPPLVETIAEVAPAILGPVAESSAKPPSEEAPAAPVVATPKFRAGIDVGTGVAAAAPAATAEPAAPAIPQTLQKQSDAQLHHIATMRTKFGIVERDIDQLLNRLAFLERNIDEDGNFSYVMTGTNKRRKIFIRDSVFTRLKWAFDESYAISLRGDIQIVRAAFESITADPSTDNVAAQLKKIEVAKGSIATVYDYINASISAAYEKSGKDRSMFFLLLKTEFTEFGTDIVAGMAHPNQLRKDLKRVVVPNSP